MDVGVVATPPVLGGCFLSNKVTVRWRVPARLRSGTSVLSGGAWSPAARGPGLLPGVGAREARGPCAGGLTPVPKLELDRMWEGATSVPDPENGQGVR